MWEGALAAFDARSYTNRIGVEGARADDPEAVTAALDAAGADTVAWYGVRLFTDHWGDIEPPKGIKRSLRVGEEAGRRDPCRLLSGDSRMELFARVRQRLTSLSRTSVTCNFVATLSMATRR